MKQTINLLPIKTKQAYNLLAFANLLALLTLSLIIAVIVIAVLWWQGNNIQQKNTLLLGQTAIFQNQLLQSSSELENRETPIQLTKQLSALNKQILAMQQISDLDFDANAQQQAGFLINLQTVQQSLPQQSVLHRLQMNADKSVHRLSGTLANIEALPLLLMQLEKASLLPALHKISSTDNGNNYRFEMLSNTGEQTP